MFYEEIPAGTGRELWQRWSILGILALLIYDFIVIANVSYHVLELSYEKSYTMVVRMSDRLEQSEGWEECTGLAVLGRQKNTEQYSVNFPPEITGITDETAARENLNVQAMLEDYTGIKKERISEELEEEILSSREYQEMPAWPAQGSVQMILGTMVIKLG
jgi:mannose/fructose/N-acetylgalactosamine-specific phosphotransferase system component IID